MPERIQLRRTAGWRMPENAVSVARPTKWGNPFVYRSERRSGLCRVPAAVAGHDGWEYEGRISANGMRHDYWHPGDRVTICNVRFMTRDEIVECYRRSLLREDPEPRRFTGEYLHWFVKVTVEEVRRELAGRDLACWCPPWAACHADVLLEIANACQTCLNTGRIICVDTDGESAYDTACPDCDTPYPQPPVSSGPDDEPPY